MSDVADGPETSTSGRPSLAARLEAAHELGNGLDDLLFPHDADVEIGQQRQRTSPLPRPAVEGDRPGDRAGGGARCERAVELVELLRRKRVVLDELHAGRAQPLVEVLRDPDPPRALRREHLGHGGCCVVDAAARSRDSHGRDPRTPRHSRVRHRALDAVEPRDGSRSCAGDGLPHALEHDVTRGHRTPTTLGTSAEARPADRGCAPTHATAPAGSAGSSRRARSASGGNAPAAAPARTRARERKTRPSSFMLAPSGPSRFAADHLRALVHEERRDVDPHRTDVRARAAEGRGERKRGRRAALRVELRLQDRADRPRVGRVVGMAARLAIDRADVDAGRAADAAERVAPDLVRENPRPPVVEQDEVEGARTVPGVHSAPDRGVRVHALAGRRTRQQLEHHLQVAERRHDLLDAHHRHEHLGQGRAHPAVPLRLDDDDAPSVGTGEVRARDGHARAEKCVAKERARRRQSARRDRR